ncbi:MAG: nicotinate (nicotinamide) nucleotide adenylyltransferase [Spirochaetia bacterium]|nr:nicotinate (nicotinamide) nucleotide adenylyltransferase [Spirochaetia bacterium]
MLEEIKPVLVFGGTFNPPHYGHTHLINYVINKMHFNHVYIIPSYHPPHKSEDDVVTFEDRLAMTRIIFNSQKLPAHVDISDIEKYLPVPSYSWGTLEHFRQKHQNAKIYMLIGMDMYLNLQQWANYEVLVKKYNFIILKRENLRVAKISEGDILLDNPYWNISSEKIRKMVLDYSLTFNKKLELELLNFVSSELLQYIIEHKLYF